MIVHSETQLLRRLIVAGMIGAFTTLAVQSYLTPPVKADPADPRLDKLCHWPSKPGSGLVAVVDENGVRRCWELR